MSAITLTTLFLIFIQFKSSYSGVSHGYDYRDYPSLKYKHQSAPTDGHRCGVCPTYHDKICGFDRTKNSTFIFDNHCIMDIYNCIKGTLFIPIQYEHCVYFGNFAYVHGFKYADMDYGENHVIIKGSNKNPDYIRRLLNENNIYSS